MMGGKERVSVIIPNWNGLKWLPVCLDSLRNQTYADFVTYVVDNGSVDGSAEFITTHYPEVRLIRNAKNLGFAGGMNVGILASKGEYVVSLNNDTEADHLWLAELVEHMDQRPGIGFAACALLDFNDRGRIDALADGYSIDGRSYKVGSGQIFRDKDTPPFEILSACAAGCLYRRSMLDKIGLYDEDFFAYMEDVDLGLRAQLAGYRCVCVPSAIVYHMGSASSGGPASAFSIRQTSRNLYRVIFINVPALLIPVFVASALVSQSGLVLLSLVVPRYRWFRVNLPAYFQGIAQALRDIPQSLAKRRKIAKLRKMGAVEFARMIASSYRLARRHSKRRG